MTYTVFTEIRDTGKTKVWSVDNSDNGSHLGEIKWRGGWRKYVLDVEPDCVWSADCLRDVAEFLDDQMEARRKKPTDDFSDYWDKISEANKVRYKDFEKPYCQEFSDILDGFVIHAPTCKRYQDSATSGTGCVNFTHVSVWPTGLNKIR